MAFYYNAQVSAGPPLRPLIYCSAGLLTHSKKLCLSICVDDDVDRQTIMERATTQCHQGFLHVAVFFERGVVWGGGSFVGTQTHQFITRPFFSFVVIE